jgi:hypothetical protein
VIFDLCGSLIFFKPYCSVYLITVLLFKFQQNYSVLSEDDIKQHQADDMNRVSTVLSISKAEACALLRSYNW